MPPKHILSIRKSADGVVRIRQRPATSNRVPPLSFLTLNAKSTKNNFSSGWFGRKAPGQKPGFGKLARETRFGARGRDTIREFGAVSDELFGSSALFLTMTLPGTGQRQYQSLAEWSSYVVQRITQWWRDNAKGCQYAWVWEWQKRGALHLHAVVSSSDNRGLDNIRLNWWRECHRVLQDVSQKSDCNLFENSETGINHENSAHCQFDAQYVQKSAARYLAKYLGKRKEPGQSVSFFAPARWWSVSGNALAEIKKRRRVLVVESTVLDKIENVLAVAIEKCAGTAAGIKYYPNKIFPWLKNFVVFSDTANDGHRIWCRIANAVDRWHRAQSPPLALTVP